VLPIALMLAGGLLLLLPREAPRGQEGS